jgi:hypothetical protein
MLTRQGYQGSKNEEVDLLFTFYLVFSLAFPTVLDVLNISVSILGKSIQIIIFDVL